MVLEVWLQQCRVQGIDHCPGPAGHTVSDTSQDAIGLLGHPGTLMAHARPSVNLHPRGTFPPGFLPATLAQACSVVWGCCDPSAELALLLVELHTIGLTQTAQPVQVPLQNLPALKEISPPTQPDVVGNLTEGALNPPGCIIDKVLKEDWPQH